ncbi:MAG: hypothetical protein OXU37_04335 [Thaumarchaeota archaeon]|nr:hypothetical protein [Nitrososphaerota archaeon]
MSGDSAPRVRDSPQGLELDCIVGNIVVTYQEIASRVRWCVRSREFHAELYPQMGPDAEAEMRSLKTRHQGKIHPDPKMLGIVDARQNDLDMLEPLWAKMMDGDPGAMRSEDVARLVDVSFRFRNKVAHGRRVCGNEAIRNDMNHKAYGKAELVGYQRHVQNTLGHVKRLYVSLGLPPME